MTHALIVDDSKTACRILERKLSDLAVESTAVFSADEAFTFLEDNKTDVIFMDHNMPVMDGLEAVKVLRDNRKTAAIPVLMYTSEGGEYYVGRAMALGAIDVLPKELGSDYIGSALAQLGLIKAKYTHKKNDKGETEPPTIIAESQSSSTAADSPTAAQISATKISSKSPTDTASQNTNTQFSDKIIRTVTNEVRGFVRHINQRMKRELYITSVDIQQGLEDQIDRQNAHILKTLQQQNENLLADIQLHKDALRQQAQHFRSFSYIAAIATLLVFAGLFYNSQQLQMLKVMEHSDSNNLAALELNLMQHMDSEIQALGDHLMQAAEPEPMVQASSVSETVAKSSVQLLNIQGESLGRLLDWDDKENTLLLINYRGYLLKVSPNGEISSQLSQRYYMNEDCYGEAMAQTFSGFIFNLGKEGLWYTPTTQSPQQLKPLSKKSSNGQCTDYSGESLSLLNLETNDDDITGINSANLGRIANLR